MKIKTTNNFSQNTNLLDENFMSLQLQEEILSKAASALREEIINEINQSSLDEQTSQELISSIEIETISPEKLVLKIKNQNIKNIEYGTQGVDEDPILLRAKIRVEQNIHKIIQAELNNIKS
ncbi:hypothetical protein NBRC116602_27730 [Hyphomicrobiales bacterium 4NK60-0047b]